MKEFKVIRKTIDETTEFAFTGIRVWKFLVKNLSNEECYVKANVDDDMDESIMIPSNSWEVIEFNADDYRTDFYNSFYVVGQGEVEVRALEWEKV